MKHRMAIAVAALAGLFISLYLLLYALGAYGALVCGSGGCETVQASSYARFLGFPVAGWGVAWYGVVFGIALASVHGHLRERRWPDRWLLVVAASGLAFSIYLTWVELFVVRAICWWCVASAVITVVIFALAVAGASGAPSAHQAVARQKPSSAPPSGD